MKVVTFDFWNTLICADTAGVRDRRLAAWLGLLAGEGIEATPDAVLGALHHAGQQFDENWKQNRYYGADRAIDDALQVLGVDSSPALRQQMIESITDPDPAHDPQPTPNIGDTLEALRSQGTSIGIICDVGLAPSTTLRRYLSAHDLLQYFDHWSFSDEVGVFKPDPTIFEHALGGLGGAQPADAAHVGDLRRTDVAGAKGMGIFAVRYAGVFDDPSDDAEGDAVISDHAHLLDALQAR